MHRDPCLVRKGVAVGGRKLGDTDLTPEDRLNDSIERERNETSCGDETSTRTPHVPLKGRSGDPLSLWRSQ